MFNTVPEDYLSSFFSFEEKKLILKKAGYEVQEIKSWISHNVYHNKVEYENVMVWCAWNKREESSKKFNRDYSFKELLQRDEYTLKTTIGLDKVFTLHIQTRFKNFLLNDLLQEEVETVKYQ